MKRRCPECGASRRDGMEAPPPDRSWVTTEDLGHPRPTRPSPMRPGEGVIGFWFSAVLGGVAFAVFIVLIVGTLP